jgi:hypothetical protein
MNEYKLIGICTLKWVTSLVDSNPMEAPKGVIFIEAWKLVLYPNSTIAIQVYSIVDRGVQLVMVAVINS